MRWLMWFAIGFAVACAAGVYLEIGIFLAFAGFAAVPLFFLQSRHARRAATVLLGLSVGALWLWGYNALYLQAAKQYDGQTVTASAVISDYSYDTDYGIAADADVELDGKQFHVRVYLSNAESLSPGDTIRGDFRFRLTTADSIQGSTYHQGDGIFLLAYVYDDVDVSPAESVPTKYYPAVLRKQITERIDNAFPQDTLAFARALLLGDSSLLSNEQDTDFKISGIRHVIAVSGLHVSILLSFVFLLSGRRRIFTSLLGIPLLVLFAAVAGFTPSVVRACIMQGLMLLALLFDKEYDPPTALSFAVLTMLAVNPLTITSVSFQLSAGCLVGIFLFYQHIYQYLCCKMGVVKGKTIKIRLLRWLCGSVSVTLSAMIATTPLSAAYFGTVSISGILTNLLTIWVVSFIFYGIMVVCILGVFWPLAAGVLAGVVSWPIRYVQFIADLMSGSVLSAVYTASIYVVIWLVLCYCLFAVLLLSRKKRPGILVGCILTGLIAAVALSWLEPQLDDYRVTVLDVGQGQSILLQSQGRSYLVDCGGDSGEMAADRVAALLLSQGITRLDGLILTHYDTDHAGGVIPLLTRIQADALYLPDIPDDNHIRSTLEKDYAEQILWIREDTVLTGDDMVLSIFPGDRNTSNNENSQCVLFQTKKCDILITGDLSTAGEQKLIDRADIPKLDLLVAGHHGAASSTGFPLLNATKPKTVAVSVGKNNYHGHPTEEVLFRLRLFGCVIRRTDLHGDLIFRG
jgi:competence protein ComEC